MVQAYVLLNCELGAEEEIIGKLKELETVKEVHGTFGAYDITVKLEAETTEMLRETITQNLRKMARIRSTLTLTVVEEQG